MDFLVDPEQLIQLVRSRLSPLFDNIDLLIVFGSLATHSLNFDSDIDLLVVSDNLSRSEIYSHLDYFVENFGIGYDVILYNQEQFRVNKQRDIIQNAMTKGVVIWEK